MGIYKKLPNGVGDSINYEPVLSATITNVDVNSAYWELFGSTMFIDGHCTFSGSGGAGGAFIITLPVGYKIDTDKQSGGTSTASKDSQFLGHATWFSTAAGQWVFYRIIYNTTTTVKVHTTTGVFLDSSLISGDGMKYLIKVKVK